VTLLRSDFVGEALARLILVAVTTSNSMSTFYNA
jgi:hypothetical protein